jgi:hypothetical protein
MTAMAAAAVAASLATAAHAGPTQTSEMLDLQLWGPDTPEVLKKAKADPYAPPEGPVCQSLPAEIEALNAALGPDADQAPLKSHRVAKWVGGAVRGLIPHRDVIRFLTQAGKKDDALKQAALAGWARRGYLKGLAKNLDCTSTATAESAAEPAAAAAPVQAEPAPEPTRPILAEEPRPLLIAAPASAAVPPQD